MKDPTVVALVIAIGSGLGMGVLSAINGSASRTLGALGVGLLVNISAGMVATIAMVFVRDKLLEIGWGAILKATPLLFTSAILGIGTLTGIAFSVSRIGVAAGLASIILGQMVMAVVIDMSGWATDRVPVSLGRITGLLLMGLATWLLLPAAKTP